MGKEKIESVSEGNKELGQGKSANVSTSKSDPGPSPMTLAQLDFAVLKTVSILAKKREMAWPKTMTSLSL